MISKMVIGLVILVGLFHNIFSSTVKLSTMSKVETAAGGESAEPCRG